MGGNKLGVEGSSCALEEHFLSLISLERDGEGLDGLNGELGRLAHVADEDLGVDCDERRGK